MDQTITRNFSKFKHAIMANNDQPCQDLLVEQDGRIGIYYAPFEYSNPDARVVIVGITPGPTQMANAIAEARRQLQQGSSDLDAIRKAKQFGAFSGDVFRRNLISQLDHWGVDRYLDISSTASLFGSDANLLQTTSLLRYPVFVDGKKYEGNPNMLRTPVLRKHLLEHFVPEMLTMKNALFIGLGPKVWTVLSGLADEGVIDRARLCNGIMHASGENTYRINYMTGNRSAPLPWKTNPAAYDNGRSTFRSQFVL
jgi:hypothetical protein